MRNLPGHKEPAFVSRPELLHVLPQDPQMPGTSSFWTDLTRFFSTMKSMTRVLHHLFRPHTQ
jgi:hypothetical protein